MARVCMYTRPSVIASRIESRAKKNGDTIDHCITQHESIIKYLGQVVSQPKHRERALKCKLILYYNRM